MTIIVLAISSVPYILGFWSVPHGLIFLGAINDLPDTSEYLAAIRQGMAGAWLYRNQFTPLHAPLVFMYPLYMAAGHLTAPLHLNPLLVYHALRLMAGAGMLVTLWWFSGLVIASHLRRDALLLALLGSGLYWFVFMANAMGYTLAFLPDLTAPEFSPFTSLLISPHTTAGLAGLLVAFGAYLKATQQSQAAKAVRWSCVEIAATILVGLTYPFALLVLCGVVGVLATWSCVLQIAVRRIQVATLWRFLVSAAGWSAFFPAIMIILAALPFLYYYGLWFSHQPMWQGSAMFARLTDAPMVYVYCFGPLVVAALWPLKRSGSPRPPILLSGAGRFLIIWAVLVVLLLFAPFAQPGRLVNGWSVALGFLAASGLYRAGGTRAVRRGILFLSTSNVFALLIYCSIALQGSASAYNAPRALRAVGDYLATHATVQDVVLAGERTGNLLVTWSGVQVMAGHMFMTFHLDKQRNDVLAFYQRTTSEQRRQEIMAQNRVSYVVLGPWEHLPGEYNLARSPYLRLVGHWDEVSLYHVNGLARNAAQIARR